MKRIAVISASPGAALPDRDTVLVDGAPMAFYVARACQDAGIFDALYLSGEEPLFKDMASRLGVTFHPRQLKRSEADYRRELREAFGPCYLTLVSSAAPLLQPETIKRFMLTLERERYATLESVEMREAAQVVSPALSGWNTAAPSGTSGVFPLNRIEALHADTPEALFLIEACLEHRRQGETPGQFKLTKEIVGIERHLKELIGRDGVETFESGSANARLSNLEEIKQRMGSAPWLYLLVYSETDQIALICQRPGEGARRHCHVTHAEWWIVLEGAFEWRLGDGSSIQAKRGDVVCIPRGMIHRIVCTSEQPGIRIGCGARDMEHVYVD